MAQICLKHRLPQRKIAEFVMVVEGRNIRELAASVAICGMTLFMIEQSHAGLWQCIQVDGTVLFKDGGGPGCREMGGAAEVHSTRIPKQGGTTKLQPGFEPDTTGSLPDKTVGGVLSSRSFSQASRIVPAISYRDVVPEMRAKGWSMPNKGDIQLLQVDMRYVAAGTGPSITTDHHFLEEARQALADPTFDIEGIDAAHKLTILAAISFGIPMQFSACYTEGISKLTREDIRYAEELGYRIKLLGVTKRMPQGFELRVHPTLIPASRLIANVEGVMNAILVKGDAVGQTMYYGPGAGAEPTASAIVADLVDARMHTVDPRHRVPHLAFQPDLLSDLPILPMEEVETAYYMRMRVDDRTGVLADITRMWLEGRQPAPAGHALLIKRIRASV